MIALLWLDTLLLMALYAWEERLQSFTVSAVKPIPKEWSHEL